MNRRSVALSVRALLLAALTCIGGLRAQAAAWPPPSEGDYTIRNLHFVSCEDTNDFLYQFNASREHNPHPKLGSIKVPLLAVNSADDQINPPELGILDREIRNVLHGRTVVIPISGATHGHGTLTWAAERKEELVKLLNESEPKR